MARCEKCGNDYAGAFEVTKGGVTKSFDSFECAIAVMAPVCVHCGVTIIGHGVEAGDDVYCCAHCAREAGVEGLSDHA